jgi:diguanylate cyclase (GGDEF)-like protein
MLIRPSSSNDHLLQHDILTKALDQAHVAATMLDRSAKLVWSNRQFKKQLSHLGNHPISASKFIPQTLASVIWKTVLEGSRWSGDVHGLVGSESVFRLDITPIITNSGGPSYFWMFWHDITKDFAERQELWDKANIDSLTKCVNRGYFISQIEEVITNRTPFSIFYVDLDGFKPINDKFGHDAGDIALQHAAEAMKSCVRSTDQVARLGGDEFAILVFGSDVNIDTIASKLISSVGKLLSYNGHEFNVGCSIGVASFPKDGTTVESILKSADRAMYDAKRDGKNCYRLAGNVIA